MTYAANLGRDEIIAMLHKLGATDLTSALGRAALQSKIGTARMVHAMMGSPRPPAGALGGPAYTLSVPGTALMFEFGAQVHDADGRRLAPVDMVLETDSRNPSAKHQILEMYVRHGLELPDTPTMALHRGRIDLLEEHLGRDPGLMRRTFTHDEIYLPGVGCHCGWPVHGTPLEGATLLHLCVDFDELEIARWLLERGMDADAKAAVDAEGSAAIRRCSEPLCRIRTGGRTTAKGRMTRRVRGCCWITGPIPTRVRHFESSWGTA